MAGNRIGRADQALHDLARALPFQTVSDGTEADITDWLTPGQVVKLLGISRPAINQATAKGALRHYVSPFGRLYDPASVERYRRQRERRLAFQAGHDEAVDVCPHCGHALTGDRG